MVDKFKTRALNLLYEYLKKYQNEIITKDDCKKAIIIVRMLAVKNIQIDNMLYSKIKLSNRKLSKSNQEYGTNIKIRTTYNKALQNLDKERTYYGFLVKIFMDKWQQLGATVNEFLNICNVSQSYIDSAERDYQKYLNKNSFFETLFITSLDYKDTGDWIETTPNAPFTIIVKDYMFFLMMNTKKGQEASQKALKECFPDLAFYQKITTDDGEYLMSSDGTEMIPLN